MKADTIYLLILLLSGIFLLVVIFWLAFHSEFVTYGEFLTGMAGIFGATFTGFWSLWTKITRISEDIGYLKAKIDEMKENMNEMKSDIKYLKRKTK